MKESIREDKPLEKILIIDDSKLQVAHLKNILGEEYDLASAYTAQEGLELINGEDFSLILLDVIMPDMDGFELLKLLEEKLVTRRTPVIMITGLTDTKHEERGLTLGAVDYITKPFHPAIVKARVRTHIKLYQYRKQIEQQSHIDPLTGIYNRRRYDEYSQKKWHDAVRQKTPFSICIFDIDNFKVYNDTFGHPAGDDAIIAVAQTGAETLGNKTDFIARYGGEEFAVILLTYDAEKAFGQMCEVRKKIEELQIPHNPETAKWLTISAGGITVLPRPEDSFEDWLKIADVMLYNAKKSGRNRVVWVNEKGNMLREKEN